jgi:hypothetical protein
MAIVPAPMPTVGAGRARVVSVCWDSSPGTGQVVSFVGRV